MVSSHEPSDLPFLITHWLTQYGYDPTCTDSRNEHIILREQQQQQQQQQQEIEQRQRENRNVSSHDDMQPRREDALKRIRRATSELASAFSDLGAFGSLITVSRTQ